MKKVGSFEAKTHLAEYLRDVEQNGEPIVIQRYGKDVAVLQPCSAVEENQKKKKAAEVLGAFEQIRQGEASCGRNEDVREMVESGRKRYMLLLLLCALAAAPLAHAHSPRVRAEGLYWMPGLAAEGRFIDNDIGDNVDFKDDLGLSDRDFPVGRVSLRLGDNHRIRLGYTRIGYRGDETIKREIEFRGETYELGRRVKTDFDMRYAQLGWSWHFINLLGDRLRIGTLVDLKGMDIKASLVAPGDETFEKTEESGDITFAFPTVGLVADAAPIRRVSVYAEAAGMSAGGYGWLADGEAGVRLAPLGLLSNLRVTGGYRILMADVKRGDDRLEMRMDGPFAGLSLNF